jgi:hypothetical protein
MSLLFEPKYLCKARTFRPKTFLAIVGKGLAFFQVRKPKQKFLILIFDLIK